MRLRHGVRILAALVLLAGTIPLLGFVDPPCAPAAEPFVADAALVLSGDVDQARVRKAVALLQTRAVAKIVLTGRGLGGDDAEYLRAVALGMGAPAASITIEHSSRTTRENLLAAAPLLAGCRRVALVTTRLHMTRAWLVARDVVPDVEWLPVPVPDPGPPERMWKNRMDEWGKLAWYAGHGWL